MIISVCGPIGFETAEKLYNENREMLEARFAGFFLKQFESIENEMLARIDVDNMVYTREISEGGIYRALWEAAEELGCGMKISNPAIPIRQEVIEILELFEESPYECSSRGSWLVVTEDEIPFTRIGTTAENKARVLEDGDRLRYLTPPERQEKDLADHKRACCQKSNVL